MQAVSSFGLRNESLFDRVVSASSLLQNVVAYFQAMAARNELRAELNALSDRELNDMGLSRVDIDAVAAGKWVARRMA